MMKGGRAQRVDNFVEQVCDRWTKSICRQPLALFLYNCEFKTNPTLITEDVRDR